MTGLPVPDALLRVHADSRQAPSVDAPRSPEVGGAHVPAAQLWSTTFAILATAAASGMVGEGVLVSAASHVQRSLHASPHAVLGLVVTLGAARLVAGGLTGGIGRRLGHWRVVAVSAVLGAGASVGLSLAHSTGAAAAAVVALGVFTAPLVTTHIGLLTDNVGWGGRGRVVAAHAAARALGVGAGALLAAVGGWRAGASLGAVAVLPALWAFNRPDPFAGGRPVVVPRLARLRSRSLLTAGLAAIGFATVSLPFMLRSMLQQHRFHASVAVIVAAEVVGALVASPAAGVIADRVGRARAASAAFAAFGITLALLAVTSSRPLIIAELAVAAASIQAAGVVIAVAVAEVVPAAQRVHALGMATLVAAFWGLTAAILASSGRSAWGPGAVLGLAGLVAVVTAVAFTMRRTDLSDDETSVAVGSTPVSSARRALDVSQVSFAYGSQPVLFDVSLELEEGEIAALLGTNGAGKSTLLRLIAGLDHPNRGTIRIFGEDTTYLEAEQLLDEGVALLSGGRMTFPGLTVAENLRVGTQRARNGRAVEEALAAFPILEARRNQRAGTLSGGEQQMLALARVLVHRPRLLLLDELTLGLAPRIIEELLASVRQLNAAGTTVLLVEQSANLALSLADHAFFMERGAVRFDGPAAELVGRDDLLRPVFLRDS